MQWPLHKYSMTAISTLIKKEKCLVKDDDMLK
jgi:hypothetical protein